MLTEEFEEIVGGHGSAAVGVVGQLVDAAEKVSKAIAGDGVVDMEAALFALDPPGVAHQG